MLYKKNLARSLSAELFKNPTKEYRGAPFWAWNTKLNSALLSRQIKYLKEMGFGGFHMHPRTGMQTEYLGEEFMGLVSHCVNEATKEDMLAWLYDEDRWPSGFAGGLVTKEHKYRARYLLFTKTPYFEGEQYHIVAESASRGGRTGKGTLIATYDVCLDEEGCLKAYKLQTKDEEYLGDRWYAYLETASESEWFNNQTYVDTLNPEAIRSFINITYEAYKAKVSDAFNQIIPAVFTDEPQFTTKKTLNFAYDNRDIVMPWTNDLVQTYKEAYNEDLMMKLPELFWELPDEKVSLTRYHYHDHIAERFAKSFADQCGKWCNDNQLLLTGHMMEEPTLDSQTASLGEAMRSYRAFGLPGIDMLADSREYSTAKQAQSAAHQFGCEGVLSELYGVTNWDFDFRSHKLQGDWQAALGVTVRVPHLAWVSMEGEAKRDYPASINYQSPWYQEYPLIEDYFARLNTALTRGKPCVKIGVIHPIESYWLHFGPKEQTQLIREYKEQRFKEIIEWLLFGTIDFDFIAESLLPTQCEKGSAPLQVGKMNYDVIIVPECETLRETTYDRLVDFKEAGGRLIFLGEKPKYMDALPNEKVGALYNKSEKLSFCKKDILNALKNIRDITVQDESGCYTSKFLYQMRCDGENKWLFICQGKLPQNKDIAKVDTVTISINGFYKPVWYDALNGNIEEVKATYDATKTIINWVFYEHDSLLLRLEPIKGLKNTMESSEEAFLGEISIDKAIPIELDEPNVYLLDMASYRLDDGECEKIEEILRLDNKCRKKLGYPLRGGQVAQPWTLQEETLTHEVTLYFQVKSEIDGVDALFAAENLENASLWVNNESVSVQIVGYYVDESIKTVKLPSLKKGVNTIEIKYPFGQTTNLECCYVLGDFGVTVSGCDKVIVAKPKTLNFGDYTHQGLPFYGGNILYKLTIETEGEEIEIEVPSYRGELIKVTIDDMDKGNIVFSPYKLKETKLTPGKHEIGLKLFGNRVNTFGTLHNCDEKFKWCGPDGWRSTGAAWSYAYQFKKTGILTEPTIRMFKGRH